MPASDAAPAPAPGAQSEAPQRWASDRPSAASPRQPASIPPGSSRQSSLHPAVVSSPRAESQNAGTPAGSPPRGSTGGRSGGPSDPAGHGGAAVPDPSTPGPRSPGPRPPDRRKRRRRIVVSALVLLLVALIAWPVGVAIWANGKLQHVDALSSHADTSGTTYLIAGSDSRAATDPNSTVVGARTDTIMLLHVPKNGTTSLISIPRDTYVKIPGHDAGKINSAFAYGGAPLLVKTVEALTKMKVDHYVEVGFAGVREVVDAVGGVRLCLDYDVNDSKSHLTWKAGCHTVSGKKALAFSRMRYSDPEGDIGRAKRQRQVIAAVSAKLKDTTLLVKPGTQIALINAGTQAIVVDQDANILTVGRLALAFRNANGKGGVTGTPPIKSLDYRPGGVGSTVQLDPDTTPQFFADMRDGKLPAGEVNGMKSAKS